MTAQPWCCMTRRRVGIECMYCDLRTTSPSLRKDESSRIVRDPPGLPLQPGSLRIWREKDLKTLCSESKVAQHLLAEGVKAFVLCRSCRTTGARGALNVGRRGDNCSPGRCGSLEPGGAADHHCCRQCDGHQEVQGVKDRLTEGEVYLEDEIKTEYNFEEIIGDSAALKRVLKQVEMVAPDGFDSPHPGRNRYRKELIARAIHNLSARRERTFVKLNCAAIPTGLLESELFGHERGAFTGAISQKVGRFELANGGTLFLDEVGDIPLELQSKLLRVFQEQEFERLGSTRTIKVDVRLVAATNRDLSRWSRIGISERSLLPAQRVPGDRAAVA